MRAGRKPAISARVRQEKYDDRTTASHSRFEYTLLLTSSQRDQYFARYPSLAYDEIDAALADPLIGQRLAELGAVPIVGNASQFGAMLALETERLGQDRGAVVGTEE